MDIIDSVFTSNVNGRQCSQSNRPVKETTPRRCRFTNNVAQLSASEANGADVTLYRKPWRAHRLLLCQLAKLEAVKTPDGGSVGLIAAVEARFYDCTLEDARFGRRRRRRRCKWRKCCSNSSALRFRAARPPGTVVQSQSRTTTTALFVGCEFVDGSAANGGCVDQKADTSTNLPGAASHLASRRAGPAPLRTFAAKTYIQDSTFIDNVANYIGGDLAVDSAAELEAFRTTFIGARVNGNSGIALVAAAATRRGPTARFSTRHPRRALA